MKRSSAVARLRSVDRQHMHACMHACVRGWFDPEMSWDAAPTGRRGRQQTYSDAAIQTCLTMKVLFGLALRQTTGFVESLIRLVGLNWQVPDFSTPSRREKTRAVNIPYRGSNVAVCRLIVACCR